MYQDFRINCTLRNGNPLWIIRKWIEDKVLIVPCGMETGY